MKLDGTMIAIRPRSAMERLDLALLICGRYPVGIVVSLMLGVIPFMLFNWWVMQVLDQDAAIVFLMFFLGMETPLATLFLTLYLGQKTFSESFSFRTAISTLTRQFWPIFLFQFLLRGILTLTVVLQLVNLFGLYHMNEILLLERSKVSTSWKRRRVLHDNRLGDIISSRFVELIVLVIGTLVLNQLFIMLSNLWDNKTRWEELLRLSESEEIVLTWLLSLAFFLTIGFLRIYRFVTYLDTRIRNEGWDVELKLRSIVRSYASRMREAT